jgi:hypothetical protein
MNKRKSAVNSPGGKTNLRNQTIPNIPSQLPDPINRDLVFLTNPIRKGVMQRNLQTRASFPADQLSFLPSYRNKHYDSRNYYCEWKAR